MKQVLGYVVQQSNVSPDKKIGCEASPSVWKLIVNFDNFDPDKIKSSWYELVTKNVTSFKVGESFRGLPVVDDPAKLF